MTSVPAGSQPHVSAVLNALTGPLAALPTPTGSIYGPGIAAYIGRRPDGDTNCVVIHGSTGEPSGTLADRYADLTVPIQLTAVGLGEEQVLAYADAARAALLMASLTVAGRRVWPARYAGGQPALRDDTVQPSLWIATAQYEITSNPA